MSVRIGLYSSELKFSVLQFLVPILLIGSIATLHCPTISVHKILIPYSDCDYAVYDISERFSLCCFFPKLHFYRTT